MHPYWLGSYVVSFVCLRYLDYDLESEANFRTAAQLNARPGGRPSLSLVVILPHLGAPHGNTALPILTAAHYHTSTQLVMFIKKAVFSYDTKLFLCRKTKN
jgi:hypothetical protein